MELTPSEINYAEKTIRRLERDSRQWQVTRWIILAGSIFLIGSSLYLFNKLSNLNELISGHFSINPKNFDSETVETFVKGQLVNLRLEIFTFLRIFTGEVLGVIGLIYCWRHWNRHLRAGIIAKALRRLLSEE
jgi:hypothetical protein